ncbi:defensin-like protein 108 [Arabidopsis lyrata subsp. lyrata]|nr:defensin-like protein 108 [Arabidopsis lyrata subsp. lyrata]|eukprot:XP_002862229.2 defensin-like protein 108 [Arabidopsis lyrata subsp. lyrata]
MAITMKSLVAIIFTALLIVSSVHCRMTTISTPGYGIKQEDRRCLQGPEGTKLCSSGSVRDCLKFCIIRGYSSATCITPDACCCHIPPN